MVASKFDMNWARLSELARESTKPALITFLEMYTGGSVRVVEHTDANFVLGETTHLGYQVALGTRNFPHTFEVFLQAPWEPVADEREEAMHRLQFHRRIDALIRTFKPAHTRHGLEIEFVPEPEPQKINEVKADER